MFSNLFMYFGPTWSAVALFAVVILPFSFALVETLRLLPPVSRQVSRQAVVPMIRAYRQRFAHAFATAHAGNVQEVRRALLRMSAAVGRPARRR